MLGDPTVVDLGKNLAKDGLSATVTLPAGLYLFVDADYSAGTNKDATRLSQSSLAPATLRMAC